MEVSELTLSQLTNMVEANESLFEAIVELCNANAFAEIGTAWRNAASAVALTATRRLSASIETDVQKVVEIIRDVEVRLQGGE